MSYRVVPYKFGWKAQEAKWFGWKDLFSAEHSVGVVCFATAEAAMRAVAEMDLNRRNTARAAKLAKTRYFHVDAYGVPHEHVGDVCL